MKPFERLRAAVSFEAYDRPPFADNEWNETLQLMVPHLTGCRSRADGRYSEQERAAAVRASHDMIAWHQVYDHPRFPILGPIPEPCEGRTSVDEDGFVRVAHGFTSWVVGRPFSDVAGFLSYLERKTRELRAMKPALPPEFRRRLSHARDALGDTVIGLPYLSVGLDGLYPLAGWDIMGPASLECPEGIANYLDAVAENTVGYVHLYAEHITAAHCPVALAYSDIACNSGLLLSPAFLRRTLWPALRKMVAAYHEHGIKVVYHSEGNLRQFLDDLIEAGGDGINPLSPSEHMDAVEIRRQYPNLILWGGIDERAVLASGAPADVRREVERVGNGVGRGLLLGSSGGVHPACPLPNLLALLDATRSLAGASA